MTQVYVVLAAVVDRGLDKGTTQVFTSGDDAVTYGQSLVASGNYDYYSIVLATVN